MKEELWFERQKNTYKQKSLYNVNGDGDEVNVALKREISKENCESVHTESGDVGKCNAFFN